MRKARRPRTASRGRGPGPARVKFRYQELVRAAAPPPDPKPFASVGGRCVPNFVLTCRRDGARRRWVLLDAECRCGRKPIHDALADVHRCRDAPRVDATVADGAHLIAPRLDPDAMLDGTQAYLATHRKGALATYDGDRSAPPKLNVDDDARYGIGVGDRALRVHPESIRSWLARRPGRHDIAQSTRLYDGRMRRSGRREHPSSADQSNDHILRGSSHPIAWARSIQIVRMGLSQGQR